MEEGSSPDSETASFYVETFEGSSLITNRADKSPLFENWAIAEEVKYNFSLCLKDYSYQQPVVEHEFEISQGDWSQRLRTDSRGCLNWNKNFHLNFMADPHFVEQIFQVKSLGLHQGQITARAALNPWVTVRELQGLDFVDLSRNTVPYLISKDRSELALSGQVIREDRSPHRPSLWIDDLIVMLREGFPTEKGLQVNLELKASPKITLRNTAGQIYNHPLTRGQFKVRAFLVGNTDQGGATNDRQILNTLTPEHLAQEFSLDVENGTLDSEFQIPVDKFPKSGTLEIYLQLIPDDQTAHPELGKYQAYYVLGDARHFSQSYRAKLKTDPRELAQIEALLERQTGDDGLFNQGDSQKQDSEYTRYLDKYHFRTLMLKYGGIIRQDETSTSRTVKILVTACVLDPLLYRPVRHRSFEIQSGPTEDNQYVGMSASDISQLDGEKMTLQTDQDGCLRFADRLSHKWYQPEQFFVKPYKITDPETGVSSILRAVINPWNTGWLFARDYREVNKEDLVATSDAQPRLFMSGYVMQARGTEYTIDDWLRLRVRRKYDFIIRPRVIRHDSLTTGLQGQEPLRDGFYLVRLALVRNFNSEGFRPDLYVNSWERVVRVRGGTIAVPIDFELQDLTMVGSRNRLLVEIFNVNKNQVIFTEETKTQMPDDRVIDQERTLTQKALIDHDSGLQLPTYSGPFIPIFEGQGPTLIESKVSATEVIEAGRSIQTQEKKSFAKRHELQHFDRRFRLMSLSLDRPEDQSYLTNNSDLTLADLDDLIENLMLEGPEQPRLKQQLSGHLCTFWAETFLPQMLKEFAQQDQSEGVTPQTLSDEQQGFILGKIKTRCLKDEAQRTEFFKFDKKVVVNKIDKNSLTYLGGESFNYNVGAGFSLSKSEGWDVRQDHRSDFSTAVRVGPDLPVINVSAQRSESWSSSESHGYDMRKGASFSYGSGAYLVIQHSNFRFHITDYTRCLIVKPRAEVMDELMNTPLAQVQRARNPRNQHAGWRPSVNNEKNQEERQKNTFGRQLSRRTYLDVTESGLRICFTPKDPYPIRASEDYYYVTQHFTTGDMHDPTDLRNRPWLLEIRSRRDFRVFLEAIHNHNHNKMSHVGELPYTPIEILSESYADYNNRLPSWPGVYSIYSYDPYEAEDCDHNQDMAEDLLNSAKEVLAGPLKLKDGKSFFNDRDFWKIYYCPEDRGL